MSKRRPLPPKEELDKEFRYDPETGILEKAFVSEYRLDYWKKVGRKHRNGLLVVDVKREVFSLFRVAWRIMTGDDPDLYIFPKDGDRGNTKWSNLFLVDKYYASRNRRTRRPASGVRGVGRALKGIGAPYYNAFIECGRREQHKIYYGSDLTEAVAYRLAAEQCLEYHADWFESQAAEYMRLYLEELKNG